MLGISFFKKLRSQSGGGGGLVWVLTKMVVGREGLNPTPTLRAKKCNAWWDGHGRVAMVMMMMKQVW